MFPVQGLFVCLFLSDLSYCLTAVWGRGEESDFCVKHMFAGQISDVCICLGHSVRNVIRKRTSLEGIFWYFKSTVVLYLFFAAGEEFQVSTVTNKDI